MEGFYFNKGGVPMFLRNRKAQGLLEYTLLLGAIVAIVVVVLMGQGGIGGKTKDTYTKSGNAMTNVMNASNSFGVFNGQN
jgi:Flp pilus assembly pilin Flp